MEHRIGIFLFIALLLSCSEKKETNRDENYEIPTLNLSGEALANMHCSRCHAFVAPKLLSKSSWKDNVLPFMGQRLGIFQTDNERSSLLKDSADSTNITNGNIYPKTLAQNKLDWDKIVDYYVSNALDSITPPQRSKKNEMGLPRIIHVISLVYMRSRYLSGETCRHSVLFQRFCNLPTGRQA